MASQMTEVERLRKERDLCLELLHLSQHSRKETFLRGALDLIVAVSGAAHGYIEIAAHDSDDSKTWSLASGFSEDEIETLRSRISTGIIAEALATGQIIDTPSALVDPRFFERDSVRRESIKAVLCIPIGRAPTSGVLYLQGHEDSAPFSEHQRALAVLFASHLAPLAAGLVARVRDEEERDQTTALRSKLRLDAVVGRSSALAALFKQMSLVAPLDLTVLLTGESGTGKSLIARVIHENGPRSKGPFVEVNCAAIPDGLLESELFGHEKGAFTGALSRRSGRFEIARNGTLFLDEIGELSLGAQGKLLRVLQERQFERVGGTETLESNARVIAATNVDLARAMEGGRFREDLFYRLQVLPVRLPTLAERRVDIVPLARAAVDEVCQRHALRPLMLSIEAEHALMNAKWPGNVRQLSNIVEAGSIRAAGSGESTILPHHLFPQNENEGIPDEKAIFQDATRRFQKDFVAKTLIESEWNVSEAARRLGVSRGHVYNLMKALGVERDS
jgi:Nif-specific regulatory protein